MPGRPRHSSSKTVSAFLPPARLGPFRLGTRKLIQIANAVEAMQDGRIFIELINGPTLIEHKATPAAYGAGLMRLSPSDCKGQTGLGYLGQIVTPAIPARVPTCRPALP